MPATTFEQIIANHGDMIARLDYRDTLGDISVSDLIDVLSDLGSLLSGGATADLQTAGHELTMAADYLTEAFAAPSGSPDKATFITTADKRLTAVAELALA